MARSQLDRRSQRDARSEDLSSRLITALEPNSPASEAYRTLRTSLLYALIDEPPKVIVLTSPSSAEGKSTVCANLGVVLAQAGKNTLIMDCDFRRPVMHKIFGADNVRGVVDVMSGERELEDVCEEPLAGLKLLVAGSAPPNPAELLGSRRFSEFLGSVRERFDYVLMDAPPAALVSDSTILAVQGDGVLLALDSQSTRKGSVRRTVRNMKTVGANVLGTVMNNVKGSEATYY